MENDYYTPLGKLPLKETVDFAKNFGFAVTFQSLAIVLSTPHHGFDQPWSNTLVAGLITVAGGVLTAMVLELYIRNWPGIRPRTRWLVFSLGIAVGLLVSQLTKARLAEG